MKSVRLRLVLCDCLLHLQLEVIEGELIQWFTNSRNFSHRHQPISAPFNREFTLKKANQLQPFSGVFKQEYGDFFSLFERSRFAHRASGLPHHAAKLMETNFALVNCAFESLFDFQINPSLNSCSIDIPITRYENYRTKNDDIRPLR